MKCMRRNFSEPASIVGGRWEGQSGTDWGVGAWGEVANFSGLHQLFVAYSKREWFPCGLEFRTARYQVTLPRVSSCQGRLSTRC